MRSPNQGFPKMIGGKMVGTVMAPMIADIKRVSQLLGGVQKYRYVGEITGAHDVVSYVGIRTVMHEKWTV